MMCDLRIIPVSAQAVGSLVLGEKKVAVRIVGHDHENEEGQPSRKTIMS